MPKRKLNNVSQRKDGRWMARKTFGYKPDGKSNRKVFYADTAQEASQKLADYERQVMNGLNINADNITLEQWLGVWMKEYKLKSIRPQTYDDYEVIIKSYIVPTVGNHRLLKLRPEHLQSFINSLKNKQGEPLAISSVKKIKAVMSGALKQAMKNGLIIRNPADALSLPKNDKKKKVGAFTPTEQNFLLNQVSDHRLCAFFVLALGTGMRIGEIFALRWHDMNFIFNEITVGASVSRTKDRAPSGDIIGSSLKLSEAKTKAGFRTIPLTSEVRQALLDHKDRQSIEREQAGSAWSDNGLVFCTPIGTYLEYSNIRREYIKQRDLAQLPKLSFHCLRHTFATNAITAGMDYYYLSRIMGHANISITLDVYADFMPDKSRSEMQKLEGVLFLKTA